MVGKKLKCGVDMYKRSKCVPSFPFIQAFVHFKMFPYDSFLRAFHYDTWQMDVLGQLCSVVPVVDLAPPASLQRAENYNILMDEAQWILRHPRARQVLVEWLRTSEDLVLEAGELMSVLANHATRMPLMRTDAQILTSAVLRGLHQETLLQSLIQNGWLSRVFHMAEIGGYLDEMSCCGSNEPQLLRDLYAAAKEVYMA